MTYTARPNTTAVVIDATGQIIGPGNTALWAVYQAWVTAGNTPTAAPSLPPVMPTSVQITSTGTPAVNGIYTINPQWQVLFGEEEISILATGNFTNGATTLLWLDNGVTFPNTAIFASLATAYASYVTAAQLAVAAKTTLPTSPMNIS